MLPRNLYLTPNFPFVPSNHVRAEFFLRKMNGGSQSSLIGASDGRFYVVKSAINPQGPNTVFNEAFGSVLAEHLGLPTPSWRAVEVDAKFLKENPNMHFTLGQGAQMASPGLYFGSNFILPPPTSEMYETVPHSWLERVRNPSIFARMLILDLWADNTDRRQALFVEHHPCRALDVIFFDHGHMFGGPYGNKSVESSDACLYYHRGIYLKAFQTTTTARWITLVENTNEAELRIMLRRLPSGWTSDELASDAIARLLKNKTKLRQKVDDLVRKILCGKRRLAAI